MELILSLIFSFFAVRGFRYTLTGDGLTMANMESFLWLLLMLFFVWVMKLSCKEKDRRLIAYSALFGVIIASFYLLGISMEKMKRISWIWTNTGYLANALNLYFSHAFLYYSFAFLAFRFLRDHGTAAENHGSFSFKRVFLLWGILILIYLPCYLSAYPGNITQDTADQIDDAITTDAVRDHHSAFLTLLMRLVILPVRAATGSLQAGVGTVTLLQMLIVTFVFAFAIEWICRHLRNRILQLLVFAWFGAYPVHWFYSVTLWKDILFSVCFLAFMLCVDAAAQDEDDFFNSRGKMAALLVSMLLLPLMRHNGISIVIIMAVCLLIRFRRYSIRILKLLACFAMLFGLWKLVLLPAFHVTNITSSHTLSILEQQMARAMNVHHEELSDEEMAEFTRYFDIGDLWSRYNPILSDSVKKHFRDDLFDADPLGFFAGWLKLGRRYPVDYIEAFLANNYGYWFPETRYGIIAYGVTEMGEIEDIHAAPVKRFQYIDFIHKYIEGEQYAKMPLIPLLFSRGACFWIWVFCGCYCLYNNRRKFILFMPGFSLWLGILISPVYNEYRYVYGLFCALPLLAAGTLLTNTNNKQPDRENK